MPTVATAVLRTAREVEGKTRFVIAGRLLGLGYFDGDPENLGRILLVSLPREMGPDDAATVVISPLVEESTAPLLEEGRTFEFRVHGVQLGTARVLSARELSLDEMRQCLGLGDGKGASSYQIRWE